MTSDARNQEAKTAVVLLLPLLLLLSLLLRTHSMLFLFNVNGHELRSQADYAHL